MEKLDKLRYLLYTVKKLSGCFSSRPTISFFITVVEFTEIFSQGLFCFDYRCLTSKSLRLMCQVLLTISNHGKAYEPDFVVETKDTIYLVEVKAERDLQNPDVIAKRKRGIQYCETVAHWSEANKYKPWKYLFIPSNQIFPNSTFAMIVKNSPFLSSQYVDAKIYILYKLHEFA